MNGIIMGGQPPSAFFKMRKNRLDAANRAPRQGSFQPLSSYLVRVVDEIADGATATLSLGETDPKIKH